MVKTGSDTRYRLRRDKGEELRHRWDRGGQCSLLLAWHPAFELEPAPAFLGARSAMTFVHMPRRDWIERQAPRFASYANPLLTARAAHFCAFLSRRTRSADRQRSGLLSPPLRLGARSRWTAQGTETSSLVHKVGLDAYEQPVLVSAKAEEFEEWLRERTQEFFGATTATTAIREAA